MCALHRPKPYGAGSTLATTSSGPKPAADAASGPKNLRVFMVPCTHLGSPVVPEVELRKNNSSGPSPRPATRTRATSGDCTATDRPAHDSVTATSDASAAESPPSDVDTLATRSTTTWPRAPTLA